MDSQPPTARRGNPHKSPPATTANDPCHTNDSDKTTPSEHLAELLDAANSDSGVWALDD